MATAHQRFDTRQQMKNSTFEIFRYSDSEPPEVEIHQHDFYEVYFFLSGSVQYNVEGRGYQLSSGDVLFIRPKVPHQPVFSGEAKSYQRFVLWINRRYLDTLGTVPSLSACFDQEASDGSCLLHVEGGLRNLLTFQLEQLLLESRSQDPYGPITAVSYLIQVLSSLNRQRLRQRAARKEPRTSPDTVVYYVLEYINEHYAEDLTLDHLANAFFTSKFHLSREFQRLVGTSVHHYILQKRLDAAKKLMAQGTPISQVSQYCGFGDYSNFYRAFKKEFHQNPKAYLADLNRP